MSSLWVAHHSGLHTRVVVKFISAELMRKPDAVARFTREASASAQIKSPHVVQVFDHGVTPAGQPFIVMELLEGRDLSQVLDAQGRLPPREAAEIITQLARALTRAHGAGVIHRDIKPANVFLCSAGDGEAYVKLLDFGVAKHEARLDKATIAGEIIGTPYYMSPEQLLGETVDANADLWALAVVAYECLTGALPFAGETVGALAVAQQKPAMPPSQRVPELPPAVDHWFVRACSLDKGERFGSARDLAQALHDAVAQSPAVGPVISFRPPMPSVPDSGRRLSGEMAVTHLSASRADAQGLPNNRGWGLVGGAALGGLVVAVAVVAVTLRARAPSAGASPSEAPLGRPVPAATVLAPVATSEVVAAPPPDLSGVTKTSPTGPLAPVTPATGTSRAKVPTSGKPRKGRYDDIQ
jgi:serine/threonine-protein kinase